MKKIIDFFKGLFSKMEYAPTEYNVSLNEDAVKVKKPAKKKAAKKPVKKIETKKVNKKK